MSKTQRQIRRSVKRSVKQAQQHKGKILTGIALLIVAAVVFSYLQIGAASASPYEITKNDVLVDKNLDGKKVSVFGIRLGDSMEDVRDELGEPDKETPYPPDLTNWEYGKSLKLEGTGLIMQFKSGILIRMTFKEEFNKYLQGQTKIEQTKDEVYQLLGAPSAIRHVQANKESSRAYKVATYAQKNMEIILLKDVENGLSFYL